MSFLPMNAQNGDLTVGVQLRPRAEYRNGFKTLSSKDSDAAFFTEQRTRLWADYNADKFRIHINMQDVRIWGTTNQIYKEDNSLQNLYEAYAELKFSPQFSAKMGRMALNYNNARFFGNLDWAAQGRSHDALLLKYRVNDLKLDAGFAFNQNGFEPGKLSGTFYGANNYKSMQFLWMNKSFGDLNVSALVQNDGRQVLGEEETAYRQTYAIIPTYKKGKWVVGAEAYYQGGENAKEADVSAYLLSAIITYKTSFAPFTLGMDMVSGTDADDHIDGNDGSFAPLYGTNHKFYGFMDYFYVGNPFGGVGLNDIYLKTAIKLNEKSKLGIHLHHFMTNVEVVDAITNEELDPSMGTEIDLLYKYAVSKDINIAVGYSHMIATETMEYLKNGDSGETSNWFFVQFNFAPTIFKKMREPNK